MKKTFIFIFLTSITIFSYNSDAYRRCIDRCNPRLGPDEHVLQTFQDHSYAHVQPKYKTKKNKSRLKILTRFTRMFKQRFLRKSTNKNKK